MKKGQNDNVLPFFHCFLEKNKGFSENLSIFMSLCAREEACVEQDFIVMRMNSDAKIFKYFLTFLAAVTFCCVPGVLSAVAQSAGQEETLASDRENAGKSGRKQKGEKKFPFVHCSLGTNIVDYADYGTLNGEISLSVSRHVSIHAGAKYNNWEIGRDEKANWDKRRQFSAGVRFWPWYIYSGWWFGIKGQYEEYSRANFINAIFNPVCKKQYDKYGNLTGYKTSQGDEYGVGLSAGYTLMLHKNLNMDFGIGIWGGLDKRTVFACPKCGKIDAEHSGNKFFLLPNDVQVSFVYVF